MKKLNLDALFHDAVEYNVCMSDTELMLLDKKEIEFEIDELKDRLDYLRMHYRFPRTQKQKEELKLLENEIVNLKVSLFNKNWN